MITVLLTEENWSPFAKFEDIRKEALEELRPPPKLSLSEWADLHYYLSPESSAEPGRWKTLPYQKEILDAFTDPNVEQISLMKSARVGYTKCMGAAVGYYIQHDPSSTLIVQPTVEDAKGYSKEEIAPMLRDCPALAAIIFDPEEKRGPKESNNTMLSKHFPGGVLSMVGANSGTGFRRISRRNVFFDEVDAYPPSAGSDGDQIQLGIKRTISFWNRKIAAGSTPLVEGASRIKELYDAGDRRRYYVPCPTCGHMDFLVFRKNKDGGHWMKWPEGKPEAAHFVCSENVCTIEHKDKRSMLERGQWRGAAPFKGHASFHIWTAYSVQANATWGQIAAEFLACKTSEELRTFVNTVLGETWTERGEAPDWQRLYQNREKYQQGTVPEGVRFLTAGVDVQKDRLVYEVIGWGRGRQSWSVDQGQLMGQVSEEGEKGPWIQLAALLDRVYERKDENFGTKDARNMKISVLAIDSGAFSQSVYSWAKEFPLNRVMAIKGDDGPRSILSPPTPVELSVNGQKIARGYKIWPVGVDTVKSELYGWLKLSAPSLENGELFPNGYCHFPEYPEEFFKQLTGEHLVPHKRKDGRTVYGWEPIPGRQNHSLDARVYGRAAACMVGLDRLTEDDWAKLDRAVGAEVKPAQIEKPRTSGVDSDFRFPIPQPMPTPGPVQAQQRPDLKREQWIKPRPGWLRK